MTTQQTRGRGARAGTGVKPFQIRGRLFTAVTLRPEGGPPDEEFYADLEETLGQTPQFFLNAPVLIDLEQIGGFADADTLRAMVARLRGLKLAAFGVQNAAPAQVAAAAEAGLISVSTGNDAPLRPERRERGRKEAERAAPAATKRLARPVRSGETVIADQGDLIVIGPVSSGAELVAAGNIHIYGRLRGRAMAGAYGDESARIFCQSLDAELLAIAGYYRTSDTLDDEVRTRNVQVSLKDKRLLVETLG